MRQKPIVRVPKFPTKRPDYEDMPFYYMYRPGKRSGNIILQQMKEDYENKGPPPIPSSKEPSNQVQDYFPTDKV